MMLEFHTFCCSLEFGAGSFRRVMFDPRFHLSHPHSGDPLSVSLESAGYQIDCARGAGCFSGGVYAHLLRVLPNADSYLPFFLDLVHVVQDVFFSGVYAHLLRVLPNARIFRPSVG